MMIVRSILLTALLLSNAVAADVELSVSTRVLDVTGAPLTSPTDIRVTLWNVATGGTPVWQDTFPATPVTNGMAHLRLGSRSALNSDALRETDLWYQLSDGQVALTARLPMNRVASAARADSAGLAWGQSTYTDQTFSSVSSGWEDTPQTAELPSAGTYWVQYSAETFRNGGTRADLGRARLSSPTIDAQGIPTTSGLFGTGSTAQSHGSLAIQAIVRVPGPETLTLQVKDGGTGHLSLYDGILSWVRMDIAPGLTGGTPGADPSSALRTCKAIRDAATTPLDSGLYYIDPNGGDTADAVEAYCDMTTDGGGWTLVFQINALGCTEYDSQDIFETRSTFGTLQSDNFLPPYFYTVPFTESYVMDEDHAIPVFSITPFTAGTVGAFLDTVASPWPNVTLWNGGDRTGLGILSASTSDGRFSNGDLRGGFTINQSDIPNRLSPQVSYTYATGETTLIFDSAQGTGARRYNVALQPVSNVALDQRYQLFVR